MADFRGQTAVYFFEHTVEYLIVDKTVAFHDLCNAVAGLHEVRINMGKPYHVDVFLVGESHVFLKETAEVFGIECKTV